ncbi:hypothetical protein PVAND_014231 [Polypedilum vanderplanki]|uniref:Coiled-coil protein 142 C-terminal domain-containing protein n=1 Tax=Polypedilum vanderplanki TaxID=319348 RepID=A0A9J6CSX2_POLVA|nr:hypothetical protein PVAND_014231 [Polypedilum vanderplanki]
MSNIAKWLPKQNNDMNKIFIETRNIERELRILGKMFATVVNYTKNPENGFQDLLDQGNKVLSDSASTFFKLYRMSSSSSDKNVERSSFKVLLNKKAIQIRQNLKRRHFQLIMIFTKLIKLMLCNGVFEAAFQMCSLLNTAVILTLQNTKSASGTLVISNTFPPLLSNPRVMHIHSLLQMVTRYRTEQCCESLISCLLATCKAEMNDETESDDSSLEIYLALTEQLTEADIAKQKLRLLQEKQAMQNQKQQMAIMPRPQQKSIRVRPIIKPSTITDISEDAEPTLNYFDNLVKESQHKEAFIRTESDDTELLHDLIRVEEIFLATMIAKCLKLCPSAFENEITKEEIMALISRASKFLWTNVGATLEHFLLWWSQFPLACRPVSCTKYLREYLMLIQPEDAPEPILSTLKSLGEILTVHVAGTCWDKDFRMCLVLSSHKVDQEYEKTSEFYIPEEQLIGTTAGYFWAELIQTLVRITNSCDKAGTIANELPIVEQIPVLHRLDHSIHTMRLWANTKAKELCAEWNMNFFFRLIHNDMSGICLERLNEVRAPVLVAENPLEVHIQVNVALRSKLTEEIKENTIKVKSTCNECIDILAAICETTSLATLSLYFPPHRVWLCDTLNKQCSEYIGIYLNVMYFPIAEATKDLEILNLTLKIICECLLENIYNNKIKFSMCGALNLLKDIEAIGEWIENCNEFPDTYREKLMKHEVLRYCEGVGKILLREPEEVISMFPSPTKAKRMATDEEEDKAPLPAEMFVPNQQRWLELRARRSRGVFGLCSNVNNVSVIT